MGARLVTPQLLDTVHAVTTAEGIELNLRHAGPVARSFAWLVDFLLRILTMLALSAVIGALGKLGQGLFLLTWFLLEWLYPVIFEVWRGGATPGKRIYGLTVVMDDGTPVTFAASVTRNLLRVVDFLPFLYAFGLLSMLLNNSGRRLGDLAAGTLVVYVDPVKAAPSIPASTPLAPLIPLNAAETRAVIDFAQRSNSLSVQRLDELAQCVPVLVGQKTDPSQHLFSLANHLIGKNASTTTQKAST